LGRGVMSVVDNRAGEATATMTLGRENTDVFLASLVRHLANTLAASHVFVAEVVGDGQTARTLAACARGELVPNFAYSLTGTPCAQVLANGIASHREGVSGRFGEGPVPGERFEGYLGVLLRPVGAPPAWIAVLDSKPLDDPSRVEAAVLGHVAPASADIRRVRAQQALRETEGRLEVRTREFREIVERLQREEGERRRIEAALRALRERVSAEAALQASEERYALAARGANDGLWDWDLERGEIYLSPRWKEMLGETEEAIGRRPTEWFERVHPEDRDRLGMEIVAHLEGLSAHLESEHRVRHKDAGWRFMLCRGLAVRDELGKATRVAGSMTDITRHRAMQEQLVHDAFHDILTGLPNRALFMDRLGRAVQRSRRHEDDGFAVLVLDLDRFQVVNDGLGHTVGDLLLTRIATRLQGVVRPEDTVARLGGDEFALLVEHVEDVSDATRVAERIAEALAQPLDLDGREVFTTATVGIAVSATGYDRPADVLRDADTALYRAKAQAPGRYAVFDRTMHLRAVALLQTETDLRRALERGELVLHYQPIVSLADQRLAGFEALARWNHPRRGVVAPAEFIPVAEETGLIVPFGAWALREVCRQAREWRDRFGEEAATPISVNLSARHFAQPGLVALVRDALKESGLPGRLLHLEITESVLMDNAASVADVLAGLKEIDVSISVDDFGTGYSCLSLLHRFPIDTLKIDREFVGRMGAEGGATVRTIVTLATNLDMDVVAEGVETPEQLHALRELDCGYGQGYLFSRPLSREKATARLRRSLFAAGDDLVGAGLVPVCAWCGRVRGEDGRWNAVGIELAEDRTTHGICPDCLQKQRQES
jgi:diguanylate cyclase (GGDEF)-like protein/PAS domain S-box-containing protein